MTWSRPCSSYSGPLPSVHLPVLRWNLAGWSLRQPAAATRCRFCYMAPSARTLQKKEKRISIAPDVKGELLPRAWLCEPSSSSLLSLLLRRSLSDDAVIMKAKPMKRDAFWGSGPWVSTTSLDWSGRSVPLPEVLHRPTRWAEGEGGDWLTFPNGTVGASASRA